MEMQVGFDATSQAVRDGLLRVPLRGWLAGCGGAGLTHRYPLPIR